MFTQYSSSDESDVSPTFMNTKSTFRVSLNLQRYFKDVRARSYMLITRNRKVRWLHRRIQRMFSLPTEFCLCTNGHLLPPSEPLGLLTHEDCIEIIPLAEVRGEKTEELNEHIVIKTGESKVQNVKAGDTFELLNGAITNGATEGSDHEDPPPRLHTKDSVDGETAPSTATSPPVARKRSADEPDAYDETPAAAEDYSDAHSLHSLKRRAIALLDTYGARDAQVELGAQPRRARRRVRRRSRRAEPAAEPGAEPRAEPGAEPSAEPSAEPGAERATGAVCADGVEAEVVRNAPKGVRAPRLVRSLDGAFQTS